MRRRDLEARVLVVVVLGSATGLALEVDAEAVLAVLLLLCDDAESSRGFTSSGLCREVTAVVLLPRVVATLDALVDLVPALPFVLTVLCGEVVFPSLTPSGWEGQCGVLLRGDRGRSLGTCNTREGKPSRHSASRESRTFLFSAFFFFL